MLVSRNIDILFVIEHYDREYDFVKKISLSFKKSAISLLSFNFIFCLLYFKFKVLVLPFLPSKNSLLEKIIYVLLKEKCTILVLNWEQYLSCSAKEYRSSIIKSFSKFSNLKHCSWNNDFSNFLLSCSVDNTNIIKTLDFNVQILKNITPSHPDPKIFAEYKKIIFLPMNYAWAFVSPVFVKNRISHGYSELIAKDYIDFSKKCLNTFITDLSLTSKKLPDFLFIVRPHPSVNVENYTTLFAKEPLSNVLVSKDYCPRYLLTKSHLLISSWSTLAYHKYLYDGKSCLYTPYERPPYLDVPWNHLLPNFTSLDDCLNTKLIENNDLPSHKCSFLVNVKNLITLNSSYTSFFRFSLSYFYARFLLYHSKCIILFIISFYLKIVKKHSTFQDIKFYFRAVLYKKQ